MEAIGICANIAGLAVIVGHLTRKVTEDLEGIKNAPVVLKTIKGDLSSLASLLSAIEPVSEDILTDALGEKIKTALSQALIRCGESCQSFEKYLNKFISSSSKNNRISAWVRVRIGLLEIKKIESFVKDLESCKHTLGLALAATYINMSKRGNEVAQGMERRLTGIEHTVADSITVTQTSMKEIQLSQESYHQKLEERGAQASRETNAMLLKKLLESDHSGELLARLAMSLQAPNTNSEITELTPQRPPPTSTTQANPKEPTTQTATNSSPATVNTRQEADEEQSPVSGLSQVFSKIELIGSEHVIVGAQGGDSNTKQKFEGLVSTNSKYLVIGAVKETPKFANTAVEKTK